MNKFNLDEYKKGVPALDREGNKWWFLAEVPNCKKFLYEIISHDGNGTTLHHSKSGAFSTCSHPNNLVSMYHEPKKYCVNVYKSPVDNPPFSFGGVIFTKEEWDKEYPDGVEDELYLKTIEFEL